MKTRIRYDRIAIALVLLIIILWAFIFSIKSVIKMITKRGEEGFIAGTTNQITLYDENYKESISVTRGQKVKLKGKTSNNNKEYYKIKYDGKDYLILKDNIADSDNEIIKEKVMYVRTPLTVYKKLDSSEILGYLPKNSEVNILGYDSFDENGLVHKYKIKYEKGEGYVYGKYLLADKDEASKYYYAEKHENISDTLGGGTASKLDYYPVTKPKFEDNKMPTEVRALYLNVSTIGKIDQYIEFAKENNINAFVVDIKDNTMPGYESKVFEKYSKTNYDNAANTFDDYKKGIKKLKDNNFYVIGRITVFKDSFFVKDHPEVAIMDTTTNSPFNHNGSYWPSGFQRLVWEFNVELAKEAVKEMGFNEIQFDYVRFPDRTINLEKQGVMDMNNTYNESKAEAIQAFLMYATDELHELGVYVSADVFGECAHNYVTNYGQYWPAISNIVDVISGMPYPDHFSAHEYEIPEVVWTVPYKVLSVWGEFVSKKQETIPTPAIVRTWIQAYNTVKTPYVTYDANKISEQLNALYENGLTGGYMTWNAGSSLSKYEEIKEAFKKEYKHE